jgi:cation transport ATPase
LTEAIKPSVKAGPASLEITENRVFGRGSAALARRFARRVLAFDEVRSLTLDPDRARATLHYRLSQGASGILLKRLAAAVAGDIAGLDEAELPRWPESEPVTLYQHSGLISIFEELSLVNGRLVGRHAALAGNPANAQRIESSLRVVPGVSQATVVSAKAELRVCFDPNAVVPTRLIRIAEAELLRPEDVHGVPSPEHVDFRLANVSLGVAAAGEFVLPLMMPAAAGLLVLSNLDTFRATAQQARERKIGLPLLYTSIVGVTLASSQYLSAALMLWFFRYWEQRYRRDLEVENRAVIDESVGLPQEARVVTADGLERLVPSREISAGQRLKVRTGEVIPLDAFVRAGAALVDETALCGTTSPTRKLAGDQVFAGSKLVAGALDLEAWRTAHESRAAQITRALIETAAPAPGAWTLNRNAEEFADKAVPPTLLAAGAGLLVGDVMTAGTVLRPDYATGVGLALPLENLRDVRLAIRNGAILRSGNAFGRLAMTSWVVLDDHEALHHPGCEVAEMRTNRLDETRLLPATAAAGTWLGDERSPALTRACRDRGLVVRRAELREIDGDGVAIDYGGHLVRLRGHRIGATAAPPPLIVEVDGVEVAGIRFRRNGRLAAAAAVGRLQQAGLRVFLSSERAPDSAGHLARRLGVDMHCCGMSLDRKIQLLHQLRQQRVAAAFVGDSATCAQVAHEAHLVIALPGEDALGSEPCDVSLLGSSIEPLPILFSLSDDYAKRTKRARYTVMGPNLVCVAGAFLFGLPGLGAVLISNFGTSIVYSNARRSLRATHDPVIEWRDADRRGGAAAAPAGPKFQSATGSRWRRVVLNEQPDGTGDARSGESGARIGSLGPTAPGFQPPVATSLVAPETAEPRQDQCVVDEQLIRRVENLPKEAGWALITAGVIGVIAPGIMGWPFLAAGAFVLTPGGPRKLARWAGRKPRKYTHAALRQICRLVDDLERRYPSVRDDVPPPMVQHAGTLLFNSRTFSNVTAEALSRMKNLGRTQYSLVFEPPDGPRSNAISQTPFGECVVGFYHDVARAELTLTLVKKPPLVPESLLWSTFLNTLERCREEAQQG